MLAVLATEVSRHTAVRVLLRLPLPALRVPRVLGVDDFALRRRHCYTTILIDAETRSSPATGPLATSTAFRACGRRKRGDAKELVRALPSWENNPGEVTMSTSDDRSAAAGRVQFAPGLWRTDLQRQDLSIPGREVIQSRVDIDPEAPAVKHTHPGEEIIYVLDGSLEYQVDGQPTRTFHAGDALTVPAGAVHAVRNVGSGTGSVLATDVVEKGKPLLTLAE